MAARLKRKSKISTLIEEKRYILRRNRRIFFTRMGKKISDFFYRIGEHMSRIITCFDIVFDYDPEKHNEIDKLKAEIYIQRYLLVVCMIGLIIIIGCIINMEMKYGIIN